MEKYGDEVFIQILRERQEEARNKDIRQGNVFIDGRDMAFHEREIVKKQLWMWLPDEFDLLSGEMARIKYPAESRPEIIYSSQDMTVNISFSRKTAEMKPGEEEEIRDEVEEMIRRLYSSGSIMDKQTAAAEKNRLAWFDFVSPALDMDVYNLIFFTSLQGKLLTGACNCLSGDKDEWKDVFLQMLASVRTVG